MDEKEKLKQDHIRAATDVNREHLQDARKQSVERHNRAKVQIKSEIIDNRNIGYSAHMRWVHE